jgi:hypothetical protein
MNVYELSPDQLDELRNKIFYGCYETSNLDQKQMETVNAAQYDHEIPDNIVFCCFSGYTFTNDDFSCTAGK